MQELCSVVFVQCGILSSYINTIGSSWNSVKHTGMKRPVLEQSTSNFPERSCDLRWLWEEARSQWKTMRFSISWKFLPAVQLSPSAFSPRLFPGALLRMSFSCLKRTDVPLPCLSHHCSLSSLFIQRHHHSHSHSYWAICTISCAN